MRRAEKVPLGLFYLCVCKFSDGGMFEGDLVEEIPLFLASFFAPMGSVGLFC